MRAVFLDRATLHPSISLDVLSAQFDELNCYEVTSAEQCLARCQQAEVVITNKVIIDEALLAQLPQLKLICVAATGTNNVDLLAAKKHHIAVTNVRNYAQQSVAQYVFAQLLEHYQHITTHNLNTQQGLWSNAKTFCYHGDIIHELAGKTMGIVGYGSLGRAVARIAQAFGMNVLIGERKNAFSKRPGRVYFEELLQRADILSLHCPLTPETDHLIDAWALSQMKPTALLINTARGGLIHNEALLHVLSNRKIAGAVLDVLDKEPPPKDHPLLNCQLDNLKITAHIAWASVEAQQRLIDTIAANIVAFNRSELFNRVD